MYLGMSIYIRFARVRLDPRPGTRAHMNKGDSDARDFRHEHVRLKEDIHDMDSDRDLSDVALDSFHSA